VFVGLSQVRETAVFSGIPITERLSAAERTCGGCVIDLTRGEPISLLRFEEGDLRDEVLGVTLKMVNPADGPELSCVLQIGAGFHAGQQERALCRQVFDVAAPSLKACSCPIWSPKFVVSYDGVDRRSSVGTNDPRAAPAR
jgi:hypothetical protein